MITFNVYFLYMCNILNLLSFISNKLLTVTRASIPMGQEGHVPPQYLWRGTSMVMSPPNILEVMSFRLGLFYTLTATTVVCCILMQILYVVSQKSFSFWGSSPYLPGLRPWIPLGDSQTRLLLCPPIILWDRRPWTVTELLQYKLRNIIIFKYSTCMQWKKEYLSQIQFYLIF